jgi:hypothetical protein
LVEPVYIDTTIVTLCPSEGLSQMGVPRLAIVVVATLVALAGCSAQEQPLAKPAPAVSSTVPTTDSCAHPPVTNAAADAVGSVTISDPRPGDQVSKFLFGVYGTVADTSPNTDLWVLSYSPTLGRFWIESNGGAPVAVDSDRSFSETATLSSGAEDWQLIAVLADASASTTLSRTRVRWDAANDWPGLAPEELPEGLTEKDCVPVIRST